jgi:hypothetical protein
MEQFIPVNDLSFTIMKFFLMEKYKMFATKEVGASTRNVSTMGCKLKECFT